MTDTELIDGIINRDSKAETEFYHKFKRKIHHTIFNRSNLRGQELEDAVTDVMIRVFGKVHLFKKEQTGALSTWITRVAMNYCIDQFRRKQFHHKIGWTSVSLEAPSSNTDSRTILDSIISGDTDQTLFEDKDLLNELLSGLRDDERTLIKIKFIDGYSNEQIGEMYGVEKWVVSNKINYLIKKIRRQHECLQ